SHVRLYLAAPVFSEAELAFNLILARALEAEGHQVYLPQRDTPETQAADRTTTIFYANLAALRKADALVCSLRRLASRRRHRLGDRLRLRQEHSDLRAPDGREDCPAIRRAN